MLLMWLAPPGTGTGLHASVQTCDVHEWNACLDGEAPNCTDVVTQASAKGLSLTLCREADCAAAGGVTTPAAAVWGLLSKRNCCVLAVFFGATSVCTWL
jgi:hypothetical protein